jgi:Cu2+-exporting ATPase
MQSHQHHHHPLPRGHDQHAGHSLTGFRRRFWIALALTIPTLLWGHMLPSALGYTPPAGHNWIPAAFGTVVFLVGGWVFLQGAVRELRARRPGMMTLIALAIVVAFGFSAAVTLGYPGMPLWEELATLITIMLLGHWIEMRSIAQAQGALQQLAKLLPDTAVRIAGDQLEEVAVHALQPGDWVLVRPGAAIPADGQVREGASTVNESMITGESRPVGKAAGERVIAGTVNGNGSLRVEVLSTGEKTALAGIMRLVAQAQASRSQAQVLADRTAFVLTLVALGAGAATWATWWALGAPGAFAIERLVTVLVIACPHALGLAIPLVIAISTTLAAHHGLLVRQRRGLEEVRRIDTVVFDKTGTLTRGEFRVVRLAAAQGMAPEEALRLAAAVERDAEHAIALGIVTSAEERGLALPAVKNFQAIPGHGVEGEVDGRRLYVGGPALLRRLHHSAPEALRATAEAAGRNGQAAVYLCDAQAVLAVFVVADAVREESRDAVERLHRHGLEVVMMTGDAPAVAEAVARELGIATVFAGVLPGDKAACIQELQRQGRRVAMVGDGVNDAPALVTADVGIAIGAGTEVAVEAGDIVLVRSDPRDVARLLELSRASYRKMVQNLAWATGYNVVALPLAAGVLAHWGILLSPAAGAVLMSGSTVVVAVNAQMLRRLRLT